MQNNSVEDSTLDLESKYKRLSTEQLADEAVSIATKQIMASTEYKRPRILRLARYWELYDGKVPKKLRQLFNVPIPIFAGMVDTLNAQYDTPVMLEFKEGDAADYFKVEKINASFQMEVMNSAQNSKWDSKLRMARKHAIINGRGVLEYTVASDPEYYSELSVINIKNFNFQPKGGLYLENHLFAGTEDIEKTASELQEGAKSGLYNKEQVRKLIATASESEYLPENNLEYAEKLARFKPLGLDPQNHSYVGQSVYKLASQILEIDGTRYYVLFHPWTKTWLRFEKWREQCSSDLFPWVTYATHEDDENFLSKSYADDLYPSADAMVAMFNQELTNREKRNFGARAYDKDMFPDVRKLDEAMHRPDALVPADTKGGTRRISEGIYEFQVGELQGTVNLIDWISGTLGRNTGANDLAQGATMETSKKASVTFAEQKSVSKRISWASQPFQDMMSDLGKRYIYGLKDHMPAKLAVRLMGKNGWDWDEITRLDLNTKKDVDVLIISSDQKMQDSEIKAKRRTEALSLIDPMTVNPVWRTEEILRSVGEFTDEEITDALDIQTYTDRKALAKASEAIQKILSGEEPEQWYGANIPFIQKIVDFAGDKRATLGDKFELLINYAMSHNDIASQNIERQVTEETQAQQKQQTLQPQESQAENPGMSGGMSRAMSVAESAV
jgi:hypothetical protein